ncbi:MAG: hypothetical protein JWR80_320 [Bradyrhizobium sp.]|nr:hypothetical protein [Bradyrhizobium sp.]
MSIDGSIPLPKTIEEATRLAVERISLHEQLIAMRARIRDLDVCLDAVTELLPAAVAVNLVDCQVSFAASGGASVSRVITVLLEAQDGGRSLRWLRDRLMRLPEQRRKILRSPAALYDSVKRLRDRGVLIKREGFYYAAETVRRIDCGELEEVLVELPAPAAFSDRMFEVFQAMGGVGMAGDIVAAARNAESIGTGVDDLPNKVYRWLNRKASNGTLVKEGPRYRVASGIAAKPPPRLPFQGHLREGSDQLDVREASPVARFAPTSGKRWLHRRDARLVARRPLPRQQG